MHSTIDRFLGGRLSLEQPARGQRAGSDAVLLAAAVPALAGQRVLEVGTGHGAALLCLGARVPNLSMTGIELQPAMAAMAARNAERNGMAANCRIIATDFRLFEAKGSSETFDHVFANPPWFEVKRHQVSDHRARATARTEGADEHGASLEDWLQFMASRLAPMGCLTLIQRAEREAEMVSVCNDLGLGVILLPLVAHESEAPKRVILRAHQGLLGINRLPGLVLHGPDGRYLPEIEAVLRGGAPLVFD